MIHKENIEKSYGTCVNCQLMVDREIEKQDHLLSRKVMQYHQQKAAEYMERNSHKVEEQENNIPIVRKYIEFIIFMKFKDQRDINNDKMFDFGF